MQIKSIVAGAAIALVAAVGSASAADLFATLDGVSAESLSSVEMAAVVGTDISLIVNSGVVVGHPPQPVVILDTDVTTFGWFTAQQASGGAVSVCFVGCGGPI